MFSSSSINYSESSRDVSISTRSEGFPSSNNIFNQTLLSSGVQQVISRTFRSFFVGLTKNIKSYIKYTSVSHITVRQIQNRSKHHYNLSDESWVGSAASSQVDTAGGVLVASLPEAQTTLTDSFLQTEAAVSLDLKGRSQLPFWENLFWSLVFVILTFKSWFSSHGHRWGEEPGLTCRSYSSLIFRLITGSCSTKFVNCIEMHLWALANFSFSLS